MSLLLNINKFLIETFLCVSVILVLFSCGKNPDLDKESNETNTPEISNTPIPEQNPESKNKDSSTIPKEEAPTLSEKPSTEKNNNTEISEKILADEEGVASNSGKYRMSIRWEDELIAKKDLNAKIIFTDTLGYQKPEVNIISFDPIMVRMGHGTSKKRLKFVNSKEQPNCVEASGVFFSMGELWRITVIATIDNKIETFTVDVVLPI